MLALAYLRDFYPRATITAKVVSAYAAELDDLPVEDVEAAVRAIVRTSEHFPTLSELREQATEHRLDLPSESEALLAVEAHIAWRTQRRRVPCQACDARGEVAATAGQPGDGVERCEACQGQGDKWDLDSPAPLDPNVKVALDLVGGPYGFKNAESPEVIRGQFLRLYRDARATAVRRLRVGEVDGLPAVIAALPAGVIPELRALPE